MGVQVGLREINHHLTQYIDTVQSGEEVIIMRRGNPIAKLVPYAQEERLQPEQKRAWERSLARMRKGVALGGVGFKRDDLHER